MNMSYVTNGLETRSFSGLANTDTVGGNPEIVKSATGQLREYADNMKSFSDNLLQREEEILKNWSGDSKDILQAQFPGLLETFEKIKPCLESIADWADEVINAYSKEDAELADTLTTLLGGAK